MNWYYFVLYKIFDDGTMDIHIDPDAMPTMLEDAGMGLMRDYCHNIIDLPGPAEGIWRGYVKATDIDQARRQVAAAY